MPLMLKIFSYLETPTASLIKQLEVEDDDQGGWTDPVKVITFRCPSPCLYFVPKAAKLRRVLENNKLYYKKKRRCWQLPNHKIDELVLKFRDWQYTSNPEMLSLPDWVVEEFRSSGKTIGEKKIVGPIKKQA